MLTPTVPANMLIRRARGWTSAPRIDEGDVVDGTTNHRLISLTMRHMNGFETVAARMLAREGKGVIWQLHLRAAASYRRGNWLLAAALAGLADTAERLWRTGG